jgi:hypothetical protein
VTQAKRERVRLGKIDHDINLTKHREIRVGGRMRESNPPRTFVRRRAEQTAAAEEKGYYV